MSDTLYENNTTYTGEWGFGTNQWAAQTFTIGTVGAAKTHNLTSIKAYLYRFGFPGLVTAHIRNTDGTGKPTGVDLTTGTYDGNTLPLAIAWVEIPVPPVILYSGVKYALVFSSVADTLIWGYASPSSYAGGAFYASLDSGVGWTVTVDRDFDFYEYGNPGTDMILTGNMTW